MNGNRFLRFFGRAASWRTREFMPCAIYLLLLGLIWVVPAEAGPCRHNDWQPTYVHDLLNPDVPYYVMPDGSFVALTGDWESQSGPGMCCLYGVRDRRGFTNCFEYTRIQCGCDMESLVNDTCRRFLTWRGTTTQSVDPACDAYARTAIEQAELAKRAGCRGISGPRWDSTYQDHYNWCLQNPQGGRDFEAQARTQALNACRESVDACEAYARTAIEQTQLAKRAGCQGISGPRWDSTYEDHYNWCLQNPQGGRDFEAKARAQALNACGIR